MRFCGFRSIEAVKGCLVEDWNPNFDIRTYIWLQLACSCAYLHPRLVIRVITFVQILNDCVDAHLHNVNALSPVCMRVRMRSSPRNNWRVKVRTVLFHWNPASSSSHDRYHWRLSIYILHTEEWISFFFSSSRSASFYSRYTEPFYIRSIPSNYTE